MTYPADQTWIDFWSHDFVSEDWLEDNPLGFSISAVGGQMVITTTGYNEWYPPIGQVSGPIAYYTAPLAPPVNGPVRFVGKLDTMTLTGGFPGNALGLTYYQDRNNAYLWEVVRGSGGSYVLVVYRILAGSGLVPQWSLALGASPPSMPFYFSIVDDKLGNVQFLTSVDGTIWTLHYTEALAFLPNKVGVHHRDPTGSGTASAWDYIRAGFPLAETGPDIFCAYGGGQYGEPEPPYGECLEAEPEPPVPPVPTSSAIRGRLFVIANNAIKLIFTGNVVTSGGYNLPTGYNIIDLDGIENPIVKSVYPTEEKIIDHVILEVQGLREKGHYTLILDNDKIYDSDGDPLNEGDPLNNIVVNWYMRKTKVDSALLGAARRFDKKIGSNIRGILEAVMISDEEIGGDY